MKWENAKKRTKAILIALSFSSITMVVILISIVLFANLPSEVVPSIVIVPEYGKEIMSKYPAPVDATLIKNNAVYLREAVEGNRLAANDKLIRIGIFKSDFQSGNLSQQLNKTGLKLFWKEIGPTRDYRILYIGKIGSQVPAADIVKKYELKEFNFQSKRLIIEKIAYKQKDFMAFQEFLSYK